MEKEPLQNFLFKTQEQIKKAEDVEKASLGSLITTGIIVGITTLNFVTSERLYNWYIIALILVFMALGVGISIYNSTKVKKEVLKIVQREIIALLKK